MAKVMVFRHRESVAVSPISDKVVKDGIVYNVRFDGVLTRSAYSHRDLHSNPDFYFKELRDE